MNKFVNNRYVHNYPSQISPNTADNESYDWQKYVDSVKTLSAARRICAYPYACLTASFANYYGKFLKTQASSLHKRLSLVDPNIPLRQSLEYYRNEFEACCDLSARRSLKTLFAELTQDTKRHLRSASRLLLSREFWAVPFAILYLIFLIGLQLFAELFLAGKAKGAIVKLCKDDAEHFGDPREHHDLALQLRPIVLIGLYAAPLTAVILMARQLITDTVGLFKPKKEETTSSDCVRFRQNPDRKKEMGPAAFYLSPVFGLTLLLFSAAGIPALIAFGLYNHLGIDALFGFPSHQKDFFKNFAIIDLYIAGLSACLMTLFFTSYFTYLCNFMSTEYDIEIYPDLIKQMPIKGWAANILTFPLHHCLRRIFWKDVVTVKVNSNQANLRTTTKNLEGPVWKAFFKIDALYNSFLHKLDIHSDYLEIASASGSISIRLWELSRKERAQLFYTIRKHAPSVHLNDQVQEALVGSAVLKDPRYTEIWFDVLIRGTIAENKTLLAVDHKLRGGKFTVKEKLTSGGQANIYLAADLAGKNVVLKEFQLTSGESLDALVESAAVFEGESTILSQLNHPGIVKLEDLFIDGNRVYLALEHVEGQTLRQLIQQDGPLDETSVLKLATQTCEILEYLHSQSPPLVHRDFTPDNLICRPCGSLKLIDFSVAQQQNGERSDCAGKHAYTPPEQFRGEACPQSDIYALGATLYFLLTGKEPEPISKLSVRKEGRNISAQFDSIIQRCTELELENRYQSIAWLKTDLPAIPVSTGNQAAGILADLLDEASKKIRTPKPNLAS